MASFERLAELDSRLQDLLNEAKQISDTGGDYFCANEVWYGYGGTPRGDGLKAKLLRIVGWDRIGGPSELQTPEAYEVAYQTIYDALPPCRKCGCL